MSLRPGEISLGTTLVVIEYEHGVILGADSRTTNGSYVHNRVTDKLTEIDEKIFCCRSGSASATQAIADIVRYYSQMFSAHNGETPSVSIVASLFQELVYTNKDALQAGVIVAGWDKYHGGSVYSIPLGGGSFKQRYALAGSGSVYLFGYFDKGFKDGMTKEEGIEFVKTAVSLAIARDASSGGCVRMAVINEAGVERLFYSGDKLEGKLFFAETGRFIRLFSSTPTTNSEQDFTSALAKNANIEQTKTEQEQNKEESVNAATEPIKDWKQTILEASGKKEVKLPQTPRVLPISSYLEQTTLPNEKKEQMQPFIRKTVVDKRKTPISQLAKVWERPTTKLETTPNIEIATSRFVLISRLPLTTIPGDIRNLASNVKVEWAQSIQEICLWRNEFYKFIGKVAVYFNTPLAAERFIRTNLNSYLAGQKIMCEYIGADLYHKYRNEELVRRSGTHVQLLGLPAIVNQFQVDQALNGYDIIDRKRTGICLLRSPDREATTKWLIKLENKREAHRLVRDADNNFLPVPLGFEYKRKMKSSQEIKFIDQNSRKHAKRKHFLMAFLCLWLLVLHVSGLYLFTRGFLLTRLALNNRSNCTTTPMTDAEETTTFNECLQWPRFSKVVLIVIDALRFDFAIQHEYNNDDETSSELYHNKLTIFDKLLKKEPENAMLFQYVADAPTTTLQRLKALTTGTLPTFIDAGSNFAGSSIEEDNLIYQLWQNGQNIAFMGDDTWVSLFPEQLDSNLTFPFPSFNVKDLHGVDDGILQLLGPALEKKVSPWKNEDKEWDVLIAHFLGVDHCGHRYGPNHPVMAAKLTQMNEMIRNVTELMDQNTLLLIMGDHGMDSKGDHGGDSNNEVESVLFMYSKRQLLDPHMTKNLANVFKQLDNNFPGHRSSFTGKVDRWRSIPQIDIVPTLSLLLGLPIPYNNLGSVIPEIFLLSKDKETANNNINDAWETLLNAVRLNARQVYRYLKEYSRLQPTGELSKESIHILDNLYQNAENQYNLLRDSFEISPDELENSYLNYMIFMRALLSTCRRIWAQFDYPLMISGISVLILSCVCIFICVLRSDSTFEKENTKVVSRVLTGGALGIIFSRLEILHVLLHSLTKDSIFARLDFVIFGATVGSIIGFFVHHVRGDLFFEFRNKFSLVISFDEFLALLFQTLHVLSFASNSYTVHEDSIVLFILQTFGILIFLSGFRKNIYNHNSLRKRHLFLGSSFLFLTRIASYSTICREEQMPYCTPTFYTSASTSVSSQTALITLVAIGPIIPYLIRLLFNNTKSYYGFAPIWNDWFLRAGLLLSAAYWLLDDNEDFRESITSTTSSSSVNIMGKWAHDFIARMAFGIALIVGNIAWWKTPLCLDLDVKMIDTGNKRSNIEQQKHARIVGDSNMFGASYFLYLTTIYLTVIITQNPMGGIMISLALLQIMTLVEIIDAKRDAKKLDNTITTTTDTNIGIENILEITILGLLATHYFFSTGHQATLSSIQWSAGFIGIAELNYIISPILVIINTLGSHILVSIAVPLLVFWKLSPNIYDNENRPLVIYPTLLRTILLYTMYQTLIAVSTSFWAGWFSRHLMVWKVFAPRFMLAGVVLVITDLFICVAVFFTSRRILMEVEELFKVVF
ncbi:834_t:CDS:10 [Ambispora leptoticha]|uniref:proteasome endopeptidase complex n=1 Tax=Ambispora leptoticha TaxID=144679 RepID=A0A9N8W4D8_9GLOM|nr:834_t:CDS:10 [Ambispora leptoticha]